MSGATEFYKIGQHSKGKAEISPCGSFQHSGNAVRSAKMSGAKF